MEPSRNGSGQRSRFITVLAWIFIVIGGFAAFTSGIQTLMLAFFPLGQMAETMQTSHAGQTAPSWLFTILSYAPFITAAYFALTAFVFAAAIGLLKRRNWARIAFVWIMVLGIVWNLAGLAIPLFGFPTFLLSMENTSPDVAEGLGFLRNAMFVFMGGMALLFTLLFGWIIRTLLSPRIRAEFGIA